MPARCAKPRAVRVGLRALLLVRCCRRSVAVPRGRAWQRAHFWCDRGRPRVRTEGHISEINIVPLAKAVPAERRESVTRQLCFYEGGWASAGAVLRGGGPGSASTARRSGGVLRAVLAGMSGPRVDELWPLPISATVTGPPAAGLRSACLRVFGMRVACARRRTAPRPRRQRPRAAPVAVLHATTRSCAASPLDHARTPRSVRLSRRATQPLIARLIES
jgi:hypothetical protein